MLPVCPPRAVSVCWKKISPGCVASHNIGKIHSNLTLIECKDLCVDEPECQAVEFGVPHNGSRLFYKPGDCQLNNATEMGTCDGKRNNLDLHIILKRNCTIGTQALVVVCLYGCGLRTVEFHCVLPPFLIQAPCMIDMIVSRGAF